MFLYNKNKDYFISNEERERDTNTQKENCSVRWFHFPLQPWLDQSKAKHLELNPGVPCEYHKLKYSKQATSAASQGAHYQTSGSQNLHQSH